MIGVLRVLVRDRRFMGLTSATRPASGHLRLHQRLAFVLEDIFGLSPPLFGVLFGVNAVGLVAVSQLSGRLVGRFGPQRLLGVGVAALSAADLA